MRQHADFVGRCNAVRQALQDLIQLAFFRFKLVDRLRKRCTKAIESTRQNTDLANLVLVYADIKIALRHSNCRFGHRMQRFRNAPYAPGRNQQRDRKHDRRNPKKGGAQLRSCADDLLRGFDHKDPACKCAVRHEDRSAHNKRIGALPRQAHRIRADLLTGKDGRDLFGKCLLHFFGVHSENRVLILHAPVFLIHEKGCAVHGKHLRL